MANQIQMRNGTLAQWQSANPVLLLGEIGYVSDKKYIVIGDGATAFTGLTPWSPTNNVITLGNGNSPYSPSSAPGKIIYLVTSTLNPFVFNLPQTSGGGGEVEIVDCSGLATGLVKIVPFSGDAIGNLPANGSAFLQNIDQSGASSVFQSLQLVDEAAGHWAVEGGQFMPAQSVDAAGTQYHLGKLHHLPLGNTQSRAITINVLTATSWTTAQQASGLYGVPSGAKGIKAKVTMVPYVTAVGGVDFVQFFSDNNSNTPSDTTGHPVGRCTGYGSAIGIGAGVIKISSEIDIPLNASGQFYMYSFNASNITLSGSSTVLVTIVGFYMGD